MFFLDIVILGILIDFGKVFNFFWNSTHFLVKISLFVNENFSAAFFSLSIQFFIGFWLKLLNFVGISINLENYKNPFLCWEKKIWFLGEKKIALASFYFNFQRFLRCL